MCRDESLPLVPLLLLYFMIKHQRSSSSISATPGSSIRPDSAVLWRAVWRRRARAPSRPLEGATGSVATANPGGTAVVRRHERPRGNSPRRIRHGLRPTGEVPHSGGKRERDAAISEILSKLSVVIAAAATCSYFGFY